MYGDRTGGVYGEDVEGGSISPLEDPPSLSDTPSFTEPLLVGADPHLDDFPPFGDSLPGSSILDAAWL